MNVAGVPHASCNACGLNTTNPTKTHKTYLTNSATFCLPTTHPLAKSNATIGQAAPAPSVPGSVHTDSSSTAGSTMTQSQQAGILTLSRATLDTSIPNLERNSTAPNMLNICAAF